MAFTASEWDFYLPITVANAQVVATMPDGGESGFPVALVIENGGDNWEGDAANIFTTVVSSANDIAVTLNDGSTQLKHDVVEYVATGGSELLVVHILVPSLAGASDTILRLYYRNDGAADQQQTVYLATDSWVAYYGLHEAGVVGGAAIYIDLSDNSNDGKDYVSAADKTGQIGAGQEFDGSNDYIEVPDHASLDVAAITIMALVNPDTVANGVFSSSNPRYIIERPTTGRVAGAYAFRVVGDRMNFLFYDGGYHECVEDVAAGSLVIDTWQHVAASFTNQGTARLYYQGAETKNVGLTNDLGIGANKMWIGREGVLGSPRRPWDGHMDELSISSTQRSADWIATTDNCLLSQDAFWTVGNAVSTGISYENVSGFDIIFFAGALATQTFLRLYLQGYPVDKLLTGKPLDKLLEGYPVMPKFGGKPTS